MDPDWPYHIGTWGSPHERSRNLSVVTAALSTWTGSPQRAAVTAHEFIRYVLALRGYRAASADDRHRLGADFLAAHVTATAVIVESARLGLERHVGRFVIDPIEPSQFVIDGQTVTRRSGDPRDLEPAWRFVGFMLRALVQDWPDAYGVCERCTLIHRRTRSHQKHCHRCRKRAPAPAVVGWGHEPIRKAGDRVTVRVDRWLGHPVDSWKSITIGLCAECGEPFHGHAHKTICDSDACRGRRNRRVTGAQLARTAAG